MHKRLSLIEVMIVVAIIAIIAVIFIPAFINHSSDKWYPWRGDKITIDGNDGTILRSADDMPVGWYKVRLRIEGPNGTAYSEATFHVDEMKKKSE